GPLPYYSHYSDFAIIFSLSFVFLLKQVFAPQFGLYGSQYVFATPYRVTWDYYFSAREHTLEIESWEEPAKLEYKHMGASFEKLAKPWITMINPDNVHSGDFLAVSKIRGRWGGFETLDKCVAGLFFGPAANLFKG
ncbi:hypothetical protein IFM89_034211, partial [Coptis chinensis]